MNPAGTLWFTVSGLLLATGSYTVHSVTDSTAASGGLLIAAIGAASLGFVVGLYAAMREDAE